ncbi:thioesterase II family protein [Paractinoplanes toevensis]|uniref:Thioesterase n=1 Tax=Paractinoplanes toevensis TaxID=571911 RepID=A0A919TEC5_9ACTN|nr:thioesterase domain-containing protein [Actinoplanes toevensis]GIM92609.1 thioesterase [Actinoplanes toevensis]
MITESATGPALPGGPPAATARHLLFCLPPAGGGATAFLPWRRLLPDDVWVQPIQLPGRENRAAEPPEFTVAEIAGILRGAADRPYSIYGHSMGGVLAVAVVPELLRLGHPGPERLFVAASRPGSMGGHWLESWLSLGDDELLDRFAALGGVPAVIREHARTRRRFLRVLRSDLGWLSSQPVTPPGRPAMPVVAIAGTGDPLAGPSVMWRWGSGPGGPFHLHTVPGGHLFHHADPSEVIRVLSAYLGLDGPTPKGNRSD